MSRVQLSLNVDDLDEAILRISDEPVLRESLVERGLAHVRSLTLEAEADRVADFIARHVGDESSD